MQQKSDEFIGVAAAVRPPARTHAERAPDGREHGEVELDTSPSNTVSNKYSDGVFKPLRWGIDSLYLSFTGLLFDQRESELHQLKSDAQQDSIQYQAQAQIQLNDHIFEVKDKGSGMFPYVLEDNCFRIQISRASAKSLPMAYVKVSSEYLSHKRPEEIVGDLLKVLCALGNINDSPKVSRIDLFVDFVSSIDMESWDRQAWVTRAHSVNQYSVDGDFSGWTIGSGGVVSARLYNKLLELEKSKKYYLIELWQKAGWQGTSEGSIWRMEFQFTRDILSQFDIQVLSSTLNHLNGLWSYATTEWLKLTLPTADDSNRSRWPIHPLWGYVSSVNFEANGGPLSRQFSPERVPSDEFLFMHGLSVLTSFMAREKIDDFEQGAKDFMQRLFRYFMEKPKFLSHADFDLFVMDRVGIKGRRFNTILNKQTVAYENDRETFERIKAVKAQAEYRKQSDGE